MSQHYILPLYANLENLREKKHKTEHESYVDFKASEVSITLTETNSLVEDRYSLNLNSARFTVEGNIGKEAMIHHHPKGHKCKHLQFKLKAKREVIRIAIDMLDDEDYERCIRGFLFISQKVIKTEKEETDIKQDLQRYFFNDDIKKLAGDSTFLLTKIKQAQQSNLITGGDDKPIASERLKDLRNESHLLPFLDW